MLRRALAACLTVGFVWCAAPPARAQGAIQSRQGALCTASGPAVRDWQIQNWIDKYFEDGNKGDKVVTSNILMVFTQCYGGDVMENFNPSAGETTGGPAQFDGVSFTNTTAMSGCQPGKLGVYGGFHVGASEALRPGNMAVDVFLGGLVTSHASEMPMQAGSNRLIGGETSTHVLVWAGDPNSYDWADVQRVRNNFAGKPNTTVTVLAGDGMNPLSNGPADAFQLELAMKVIGAKMDDGADEQFIFYVADHGTKHFVTHGVTVPGRTGSPASVPPAGQGSAPPPEAPGVVGVPMELETETLTDMLADPGNQPTLMLGSIAPLSAQTLSELTITLGTTNRLIVPMNDPSVVAGTLVLPDGTTVSTYTMPAGEEHFDLNTGAPTSAQFLEIANAGLLDLRLESVTVSIGDLSKVPEPSAAVVLLAGAAPVLLGRRRMRPR